MALGRSAAVVIGTFPLGESDSVVTFFSREHGRLRGVARAARRVRSRFAGSLELFGHGQLVFFDGGRSELVRIDHFDVTEPFAALREDLDRIAHAAWITEVVGRLTGERDRQPALYGLLVRSLRAMNAPGRAVGVAVCFGARVLDVLGHRPRLDRCVECGRAYPFPRASLAEAGLVCAPCGADAGFVVPVSAAAVAAFARVRAARWEEAVVMPIGRADAELRAVLDAHVSRLIGQPMRSGHFLRQVAAFGRAPGRGSMDA